MNCLVTGGAGFVGSNLVDELIKLDHKVTVIDNLSVGRENSVNEEAEFHSLDITDLEAIKPLFAGIDYVFHLASLDKPEDPETSERTNICGASNVLSASADMRVRKVIYTSTYSVYGRQKEKILHEELEPNPISPFALQKYVGEMYCRLFHNLYGLSTVSLRYFNVYGYRQDPTGPNSPAIATFLQQRSRKEILTIFGDGDQVRDYISVSDVVKATISTAISNKVGAGEAINIGSGLSYSVNELADMFGGSTNHFKPRLEIRQAQASTSLAKQLLNWEAIVQLPTWIKWTKQENILHFEDKPYSAKSSKRKKILFAVSPSGWAYDLRCQALMKHLALYYNVIKETNQYAFREWKKHDLIYVAGFETLKRSRAGFQNCCTTIGGLVDKTIEEAIDITRNATAIAVPNFAWYEIFQKHLGDTRRLHYITNGVNTKRFKPCPQKIDKEFIIGWVGNDKAQRLPIKRIDVLRRTCKELRVELVEQNWSHNKIPHNRMPEFYKKIDLYVNCSTTEGSSNPILEACSAGIPVLATQVGNVPQLIDSGIIPLEHDLSDLSERIKRIRDMSQNERKEIGQGLRQKMVDEFDWAIIAEKYKKMFDYCLEKMRR